MPVATKQDIAKLDSKLDDSFNDVTALLRTFMQQVSDRFLRTEEDLDQLKADNSKIFERFDGLLKLQEINDDERLVMGHQLDRLDKWTHELADKIGYKLSV